MRWNSYCRRVVDAAVSPEYMVVELFDIQDLASSPSHREASRVHIAKRSRGFGRRLREKGHGSNSSGRHLFFTLRWSDAPSPSASMAGEEVRK
jgi:hypothetical protein